MTPPGSGRLVGVDVARAVALLGMYAAHLTVARDASGPGGVDPLFQVVAGRSSALFALLAGVGIALANPLDRVRADPGRLRRRLAWRALLVALIGLALGHAESGLAVILTFYGVLFLCALPVLGWSARRLGWLALGWALLSPVASLLLRRQLEAGPKVVPSFAELAAPVQLLQELLLTGYYPVLTWATYLFAGMAVGRLRLGSAATAARLALVGAWTAALALAVSAWLTRLPGTREALLADPRRPVEGWAELDTQIRLGLYGTHPTGTPWWLAVWSPHSGSVVDLLHTTGTALLVLGLALWLVALLPRAPWWLLGGAGAMTLTLYTVHVLVVAALPEQRTGTALALHAGVSLLLGAVAARLAQRGPLEAAVRTLARRLAG